jgi:hypothetical protein
VVERDATLHDGDNDDDDSNNNNNNNNYTIFYYYYPGTTAVKTVTEMRKYVRNYIKLQAIKHNYVQ